MQFGHIRDWFLSKIPIGYYDGQLHELCQSSKGKWTLKTSRPGFTPKILIVARDHYRESLNSFAVVNGSELRKMLELNQTGDSSYFWVSQVESNLSWVNQWIYDSGLPQAFITLPETVLLAEKNTTTVLLDHHDVPQLFVTESNQGIYSARPNPIINSVELFLLSSGVSNKANIKNCKHNRFAESLFAGISSIPLGKWLPFIKQSKTKVSFTELKWPMALLGGMALVYLSISSFFIMYQQWHLEEQIAEVKSDVTLALDTQQEVGRLSSQIEQLNSIVSEFKSNAAIWDILLPIYSVANISQVRFEDDKFVMTGETTKAIEVLSLLSAMPGVTNAQFDFPISKSGPRERFTLSFQWTMIKLNQEQASEKPV